MKISFQFLSHQGLQWSHEAPENFTASKLAGSMVRFASGGFGNICIQEIKEDRYSICYYSAGIVEPFEYQSISESKGWFICAALQNHIYHRIKKEAAVLIREGQLVSGESKLNERTIKLEPNHAYSWIELFFSSSLIHEVTDLFPGKENVFVNVPQRAGKELREIIQVILRCSYADKVRRYFFELKIRELLLQFFTQLTEWKPDKYVPSSGEIDAVYAAEKLITADLVTHQFIPDLARRVNMNESYFKAVFKQVFGAGPFEYRQQKRMEQAKELLETGLSVKEVAILTGYRITNFVNAFRDHFGYTPGSIKRGKR